MSQSDSHNAGQCAQMRARVEQLASSNWTDAIKLAAEIPLVWYRVQSLAEVAKSAPADRVDEILQQAVSDAASDMDAYRRVAVLKWVIDAALFRDRRVLADRILQGAMAQVDTVTPMKSRAAALELLLEQAIRIGDARQVAEALLDAAATLKADPIKKWRKWGDSYVNRAARILSHNQFTLAESLLTERFGPERAAAILARHSVRRAG